VVVIGLRALNAAVAVSWPVPPLKRGSAVPDNPIAKVPELVIGEPEILRNPGTVRATEVTVPLVAGGAQAGRPPTNVKTWVLVPAGKNTVVFNPD
jgi:hypothetical protein